jgi:hypothetical protein
MSYLWLLGIILMYLGHFIFLRRLKSYTKNDSLNLNDILEFFSSHSRWSFLGELLMIFIGLGLFLFGIWQSLSQN